MKPCGDYELSDVPKLMQRWKDSRCTNWTLLLQARAALIDGCGDLMDSAEKRSCGLTADERRNFDDYSLMVRQINSDLARIKAAAIADHGADMIHYPF